MEISGSQRKDYIVLTAIDLIHEKGIQNVSTKEIAKRLGISEGLVFKTFPKKNEIYMAVLEHFSRYDSDMYHTALDKKDDPIEAIEFVFDSFLVYYENYPAITSVYQILDTLKEVPDIELQSKEIYCSRLSFLTAMLVKAQDEGRVKPSIDTELVADVLLSILRGICIKWRLMNYSFPLRERTNSGLNLLLESIKN